ncbi:hypothetical protein B0H16DRAFT_1374326 [Mycena metata]|uniref:GDP-fucose protein O-fucosyltransferase 2 n=1 Tax=Mycena metata TaxID=1033252 RepID=A0AAD7ITU0_9AGAR|nr:hypothetical protein B0H16DRAFT_1374326 [Mycena metata]
MQLLARRRIVLSTLICGSVLGGLLCKCILLQSQESSLKLVESAEPDPELNSLPSSDYPVEHPIEQNPLHPFASLRGPPTPSFKDNLRNETKYVTSWGSSAGWTNDVISFINLLYLAVITDRTAILPVFVSTHLPGHAPGLVFSDAFDLPRLRRALGRPVLEWQEIKEPGSKVVDDLGCWNVWGSVQYNDPNPRHSHVPWLLNLDISYTKTPSWVKMIPNYEHDQHSTFWSLAALAFPNARESNIVPALPSPRLKRSLEPDDQLLCFDFLYYVAAQEPFEIGLDYSPGWRYVGQYMRWTEALERLADQYVRLALGVADHQPIPSFITVHARREDFAGWCSGFTTEECFAPLSAIDRRVQEVKAEILQRKGIEVEHVIITSDEQNRTWWNQIKEMGWRTPDHVKLKTEETHGIWYPVLIDAVIQSQGAGFVGTLQSTFSIISARRVDSWNDGPVRMVAWGRPGADDH